MVKFLETRFCRHLNNPMNLNLQLQLNLFQFKQLHIQQTPWYHSFISIEIITTIIRWLLQLLPNSAYPTIFILNYKLITYTILHTIQFQYHKNTTTMAKYTSKQLDNKSNQRASIYRQIKVKRTRKRSLQSAWNMETTKYNSIMDHLDD